MPEKLGDRIRRLRTARGLTIKELAFSCGVHERYPWRWENAGAAPTAANLPLVASALGVSVDTLLTGVDASPEAVQALASVARTVSRDATLRGALRASSIGTDPRLCSLLGL